MGTEKIIEIIRRLEKIYPEAECALKYNGEPWKLLIMARLSAQCTDLRVNIVSKDLFEKYPTLYSLADADITELENTVRSCGLYKTKSANIKAECKMLIEDFNSKIPDNMEDLLKLPGVGRKIANLILGDIYSKPAIVTDTHCIRLTSRLGFTASDEKSPTVTEKVLKAIVTPEKQSDFCHRLVLFGREYCTSRSPKCHHCPISDLCEYHRKEISQPFPQHP